MLFDEPNMVMKYGIFLSDACFIVIAGIKSLKLNITLSRYAVCRVATGARQRSTHPSRSVFQGSVHLCSRQSTASVSTSFQLMAVNYRNSLIYRIGIFGRPLKA